MLIMAWWIVFIVAVAIQQGLADNKASEPIDIGRKNLGTPSRKYRQKSIDRK